MGLFKNRQEAGQKLAKELMSYAKQKNVVVLGLPRGGIPVAFEIAKTLKAPLDVLIVRKLGVPGHKELAMGAIASGGVQVMNPDVVKYANVSRPAIDQVVAEETRELTRRETAYRGDRSSLVVKGKTVVVVDDGIATGATMRAAVDALQKQHPAKLIVAAPTAARDTYVELSQKVDEVVCLATPEPYIAVGLWYQEFPQTTDEEVRELLSRAPETLQAPA